MSAIRLQILFEEATKSPMNICSSCSVRLADTYDFYKIVRKANEFLQAELQKPGKWSYMFIVVK